MTWGHEESTDLARRAETHVCEELGYIRKVTEQSFRFTDER